MLTRRANQIIRTRKHTVNIISGYRFNRLLDPKAGRNQALTSASFALNCIVSCRSRTRDEQRDSEGSYHKGRKATKGEFAAMPHISLHQTYRPLV